MHLTEASQLPDAAQEPLAGVSLLHLSNNLCDASPLFCLLFRLKSVSSVTRLVPVYYDGYEIPRVLHRPRYDSYLKQIWRLLTCACITIGNVCITIVAYITDGTEGSAQSAIILHGIWIWFWQMVKQCPCEEQNGCMSCAFPLLVG
jgi:hypothetical protein